MIVVADASPVNVLVRIGHVEVLPGLFGGVLIPPAVASELSHPNTPPEVKAWLMSAPLWLEVRAPAHIDVTLGFNDPGEVEAISLAMETNADLLLADDKKARRAANERGLLTTGAIGVLELAAARDLLDLPDAFVRLRATNFAISNQILDAALARDAKRQGRT